MGTPLKQGQIRYEVDQLFSSIHQNNTFLVIRQMPVFKTTKNIKRQHKNKPGHSLKMQQNGRC